MDLIELRRRRHIVSEKLKAIRAQREQALLQGRMITVNTLEDWKMDLNMPDWYPVLIIVPPTTLQNWRNEFASWTHFGVAAYIGEGRDQALEKVRRGSAEVLLTAKSLFMQQAGFKELNTIPWKLVIIDEFHLFKVRKRNVVYPW